MATEVTASVEENIAKKIEEKVDEHPPCEDPKPAVEAEAEAVEKSADVEQVVKEAEAEAEAAPATPSCEGTPVQTPSFKEESYKVGELKEAERKALEELRAKVEEAIRKKTFLKKKKKVVIAVEEKKEEGEEVKATEEKKEEEVKEVSKVVEEEKKDEEVKVVEGSSSVEEGWREEKGVEVIETTTEVKEEVIAEEREVKEEATVAVEEEAAVVVPQNYYVWDIPILDEFEIPAAKEEAPKEVAAAKEDEEAEAADKVEGGEGEAAAKEEECKAEVEEELKTSKTDVLLIKFLKARKWKVDEAYHMLRNTIKWRQSCDVDALLEQEQDAADEAEFGALAFTHGVDKGGHPVCYNTLGVVEGLASDKDRLQRFFRWRLRVMERSVRALDFTPGGTNAILQVIDLQNSAGALKSISASKHFLALLHENYPELAAKQIILNVPWWYLPPLYRYLRQQPKVVSAGPTKTTETLFKYISPEQVPVQYGGLSRPNDTDFHDGVEAPVHELYVKAGEKREIELPVDESCGATLIWDVSVVGWDIVYGEEFVPKVYTVIVRKPSKIEASHKEAIRNSFKASEPGKLVITIDNSFSKKKKLVVYRFTTKL